MSRPTKMKAATLILDYNVYPRHKIDQTNVKQLRQAMIAGALLPPVIVDATSLRVVDGFHRVTAALADGGEDAEIMVERIDYASEQDLFLDAVRRNASHGVRLSSYDQARVIDLAEGLHVDPELLASAMSLTVDLTAKIRASRTATTSEGNKVQVKRSMRHLAGKTLTPEQVTANEKASGWPIQFHAEQVMLLLDVGAVDLFDEMLIGILERCAAEIRRHIGEGLAQTA